MRKIQNVWQQKGTKLYFQTQLSSFGEAFDLIRTIAEDSSRLDRYPMWKQQKGKLEIWVDARDDELRQIVETVVARKLPPIGPQENPSKVRYEEVKLFTDGGSRGNPGPSAGAYVIIAPDEAVVETKGYYLGLTTNNQAEYQALKHGLERAKELGVKKVHVYMDSLLVVNQMKGEFKIKNRELWPIYQNVHDYCQDFDSVQFTHVPRELNKLADQEVNRVLDELEKDKR